MVPRAHFGPIPIGRLEISIDEPQYRWMREHGTLHIPDVRAQNDFPMLGSTGGCAHLLGRSPSSAGGTHWSAERTSHRGAPLHPGADQAARNLRRPGGHRDRERAACSKNSRNRWSSKLRRAKSWASSPARRRIFSRCWMRSPRVLRVCATRTTLRFDLREGNVLRLVAHRGPIPFCTPAELPIDRDSVVGRALVERQLIHVRGPAAVAADGVSPDSDCISTGRYSNRTGRRRCCARDVPIGTVLIRRHGGPTFHRKTDQIARNLCRPSRHRHRERAVVQGIAGAQRGIARSAGTSDGNGRGARHHQPLADGRAAGLDAIVESAARVCGIDDVVLRLHEGNIMVARAHFGPYPLPRLEISTDEPQVSLDA